MRGASSGSGTADHRGDFVIGARAASRRFESMKVRRSADRSRSIHLGESRLGRHARPWSRSIQNVPNGCLPGRLRRAAFPQRERGSRACCLHGSRRKMPSNRRPRQARPSRAPTSSRRGSPARPAPAASAAACRAHSSSSPRATACRSLRPPGHIGPICVRPPKRVARVVIRLDLGDGDESAPYRFGILAEVDRNQRST